MALFNKNNYKSSFMDEIRCDEPSYLIWKWHPSESQAGVNNRENAIRYGSSLRVKDGEVAIFVYKQKDGIMHEYIEGPYDQIIKTDNFPVLASIIGLAYEGGTPFQAEIYFINLARIIQTRFAVPFFDVFDPRFMDFSVPVAVRGTISFRIDDYREFIKLHRLTSFSLEDFQKQIKDAVSRYVKDAVTNAPAKHNIPVVQIESISAQLNDDVEYYISERLRDQFGVEVTSVDIGAIEIDKTSNSYYRLMDITRNITSSTLKAQASANIKDIHDKQRINAEHLEETLRIQREEAQYAQRTKTRTANFSTYQTESQTEVGIAGAEALGKMGASSFGSGSDGINMAAMMAGMAMGSAVGQNIAGTMSNMMSGVQQASNTGAVPPPIPSEIYYVAVNGQATGPYSVSKLKEMAANNQISRDTLVWKQGMANWETAGAITELYGIWTTPPSL